MSTQESLYQLNHDGSFVIRQYNRAKPFSNFFPGIAGVWGTPMWVFYTNRGQAISSFGIESKDKAICEFQPANKAFRQTSLHGFRTFLKISSAGKAITLEPFQDQELALSSKKKQQLTINSHDLTLSEHNLQAGIQVDVNYFTLPEEPTAALVRRLTIKNISRKAQTLEIVDGLPMMVCFGINEWALKNMSRTVEAWIVVDNLPKKAPYYHLKVDIADKPIVEPITEGNFYFAFVSGSREGKLLDPIIEASKVFGACQDYQIPQAFWAANTYSVPKIQFASNRTPCAFSFHKTTLKPGQKVEIISLAGYAASIQDLNSFVEKATRRGYVEQKAQRNQEIIQEIKNFTLTKSASSAFDAYAGQTFLDNVLRGGLPVSLAVGDSKVAFNVYSRKHGDPERDYNYFLLSPTNFSQGNGNYRDVNQNRRSDVWFNQDVKDAHIINFLSLSQADGYNPLVVKGLSFSVVDKAKVISLLSGHLKKDEEQERVLKFLDNPFQPGELLRFITQNKIGLKKSLSQFLGDILTVCQKNEAADHGEGFWVDHWQYNLDMIESYLAVYPESLKDLLLGKKSFTFFHNAHYVLSRDERYVLTPEGVRQYHSVKDARKEIKTVHKDNRLRVKHGEGHIYHTHLLAKLLVLVASKAATLDPDGIGIEMEADKPSWYDALNGLPGLLGSSICETFELKRLAKFLLNAFEAVQLNDQDPVEIFVELAVFVRGLLEALRHRTDALIYWDRSNEIKEQYREKVRLGLDGHEEEISIGDIKEFLRLLIDRIDEGIAKAKGKNGLFATYFAYDVIEHEPLEKKQADGRPFIWPLKFKRHDLTHFLEGFVHGLKVEDDPTQARQLYNAVRQSALFDKKLKMYKVNADLRKESQNIGRCHVFPAGWLENESVWLHMAYKYLLEIFRAGLYAEFFADFKTSLVPFLNPNVYGRSILENSSFIVSSAHEDPSLHGQGFVARLSGSTAEFLQLWLLMNVGTNPFRMGQDGQLTFAFRPVLPGWMFTQERGEISVCPGTKTKEKIVIPANSYAFNLFGETLVVYHNPRRVDTFGEKAVVIERLELTYAGKSKTVTVKGEILGGDLARDLRDRKLARVDAYFR